MGETWGDFRAGRPPAGRSEECSQTVRQRPSTPPPAGWRRGMPCYSARPRREPTPTMTTAARTRMFSALPGPAPQLRLRSSWGRDPMVVRTRNLAPMGESWGDFRAGRPPAGRSEECSQIACQRPSTPPPAGWRRRMPCYSARPRCRHTLREVNGGNDAHVGSTCRTDAPISPNVMPPCRRWPLRPRHPHPIARGMSRVRSRNTRQDSPQKYTGRVHGTRDDDRRHLPGTVRTIEKSRAVASVRHIPPCSSLVALLSRALTLTQ